MFEVKFVLIQCKFDFLDILTDHSPALSTIPPQAMKRGYEVDIEEIHDGEWKIRLSK